MIYIDAVTYKIMIKLHVYACKIEVVQLQHILCTMSRQYYITKLHILNIYLSMLALAKYISHAQWPAAPM
jgi:hypothetical protein